MKRISEIKAEQEIISSNLMSKANHKAILTKLKKKNSAMNTKAEILRKISANVTPKGSLG